MLLLSPQATGFRKIKNDEPFPTWIHRFKPDVAQTLPYVFISKIQKAVNLVDLLLSYIYAKQCFIVSSILYQNGISIYRLLIVPLHGFLHLYSHDHPFLKNIGYIHHNVLILFRLLPDHHWQLLQSFHTK